MATTDERLQELGITLPEVTKPRWAYVPSVQAGNLLFISGQIGVEDGHVLHPGKLGRQVDVPQGQEAARGCALAALAVARAAVGLDRVFRVVKTTVFVASAEGFTDQPTVANGASDLLREVFGEVGLGARSAIGVYELPLGASVEAEFIFEVRPAG